MSDPSVSDVDNDDIDQMIKGIDEFDDNLFSKPTKKSKDPPKKENDSKLTGKKVKFEEEKVFAGTESKLNLKEDETQDLDAKIKPKTKKEIHFDNDDDILGSLESKPKPKSAKNVMDDIFGTEKTKNNSFMDDIFGEKSAPKKPSTVESRDFKLEPKYIKPENDSIEPSTRRRRGNPTLPNNDTVLPEKKETASVPKDSPVKPNQSENPFPWMSGKSTSQTQDSTNVGAVISHKSSEQSLSLPQNSSIMFQPSQPETANTNPPSQQMYSQNQGLNTANLVDTKHQEIFNKELEIQNDLLARRRVEYSSALEKQRAEISKQYEMLQAKQTQVEL